MTRHRATSVRPRYGRLAALGASVTLTTVALLGGTGVLSSAGADRVPATAAVDQVAADVSSPVTTPSTASPASPSSAASVGGSSAPAATEPPQPPAPPAPPVPADSGHGRRIVFSQSLQRVWLVAANDDVERTYLVSGSLTDNLHPGTYAVFSRSKQAYGIDDSGTMKYFVRFTHGQNAAIGFHDIPVLHGRKLQTRAQLGTPQSHGCIRQWRPDAIALWRFAPIGTAVVVTA
jgi:hypothetical protein